MIDTITATIPRRPGAVTIIRTAHSVLAWPLRYHRIHPPPEPDSRDPDPGLPPPAQPTTPPPPAEPGTHHRPG
jgi:hypothetical protein